jgi:hypothetical protein
MKLLNQGFLVVKLKLSLPKFHGRHHDLGNRYGESVSLMMTDMFVCRNHNSAHPSFMTYHLMHMGSSLIFSIVRSLVLCVVFFRWLFVHLVIALSGLLRFMASILQTFLTKASKCNIKIFFSIIIFY